MPERISTPVLAEIRKMRGKYLRFGDGSFSPVNQVSGCPWPEELELYDSSELPADQREYWEKTRA